MSNRGHAETGLFYLTRNYVTMADMEDDMAKIADKVRGIASEKRKRQSDLAVLLGISRQAVNQRLSGRVPISAHEILRLSQELAVPVESFFPGASSRGSDAA